ncbi:hypothetical protein BDV26DRAFT_292400 [Aspergillus bertholletiae]|uniref:Bul1 C-terminal domain-containing protein n=1 Tax=Aspergillus bertholletiae TaxID=1226010 RepID=A0A5N7B960_9EURO|nr:hypothetical protein BDV26DRAFT_292400 [Aspergillus bertholletiae]
MTKIPALLHLCAPNSRSSSLKVSVSIHIAGSSDSRPVVFTTSDKIEGVVTITVAEKTAIDDINITFEGMSRVMTWGGMNGPPLIGTRQTFMKLHHPIETGAYQPASILEPGWCYKFPFTFVVPKSLPLTAYDHEAGNAGVTKYYTRLPPSMCKETDTECYSIKYFVRVVIPRPLCGKGQTTKSLVNTVRPVKIVPSGIMDSSISFVLNTLTSRKDLRIRSGWRGRRTGHLTFLASHAEPILSPFRQIDTTVRPNTSIQLDFAYNPVGTQLPPRLRKVYPKLNLVTSFHATRREEYPPFIQTKSSGLARGNHVESLTLPPIDITSTKWTGVSSANTSAVCSRQCHQPMFSTEQASYTSSILVPISIPEHKDIMPSFQSSLISRSYTLELILCYSTAKGTVGQTVKIEIPVEVTV